MPFGRNHKRRGPSIHKRNQSRALIREAIQRSSSLDIMHFVEDGAADLTVDDFIACMGELTRRGNAERELDATNIKAFGYTR